MHTLLFSWPSDLSNAFAVPASLLVASMWQGLLLTAAMATVLRVVPDLSPATRSGLWTGVLLLVLGLPWAEHPATRTGAGVWHLGTSVSVGLVALWILVSCVRLLQLAGNAVRLRGIVRRTAPVVLPEAIREALPDGSRRMTLCSSAEVDRPSVAGFLRPRILLPPDLLAELSEGELMQVVLHEAEHLRRYDDWTNLLQQVSLALFPLNPALFWLNRRLSFERELACDDGVLRFTGARKAYAACLARVAEHALVSRGVSLALGLLGSLFDRTQHKPEFATRVERILGSPNESLKPTARRLVTAGMIAALSCGAGLLAHSPQLVSFAPPSPWLAQADPAGASSLRVLAADSMAGNGSLRRSGQPLLVKAVMPVSPFGPSTSLCPATRVQGCRPNLRVRVGRHAPWQHGPRVLLSSWQVSRRATPLSPGAARLPGELHVSAPARLGAPQDFAMPHLTPVLFRSPRAAGWYAAVPFEGGWLVVQL